MINYFTRVRSRDLCVLELAAGSRLRVLSGRIWLTESARAADFVLESGMTHLTRNDGKLLIDAADEAVLEICAAQAKDAAASRHPAAAFA